MDTITNRIRAVFYNLSIFQVDWFEDQITDLHRKVRTKESISNTKELQDCVEMMRSHRDKKFKEELARMKEEVGIIEEEKN